MDEKNYISLNLVVCLCEVSHRMKFGWMKEIAFEGEGMQNHNLYHSELIHAQAESIHEYKKLLQIDSFSNAESIGYNFHSLFILCLGTIHTTCIFFILCERNFTKILKTKLNNTSHYNNDNFLR